MKSTFTSVMACAAMAGLLAWSSPATPAPALDKGQFATEADAKASYPTDSVVWANLRSKVYHASTSRNYGKTKRGAGGDLGRLPCTQAAKEHEGLTTALSSEVEIGTP
jgi:hypothetical protein